MEHVPEGDVEIPLGQARIARQGTDVTLVAWGQQVKVMEQAVRRRTLHQTGCNCRQHSNNTCQATEVQEQHGISCEVIDLRTLLPWDRSTVGMWTEAALAARLSSTNLHTRYTLRNIGQQDWAPGGGARGIADRWVWCRGGGINYPALLSAAGSTTGARDWV